MEISIKALIVVDTCVGTWYDQSLKLDFLAVIS